MALNKEFNFVYSQWFGIHFYWLAHKPQNRNWSRVSWNFIKFEMKMGVWKRGKQAIIEAGISKKHWKERSRVRQLVYTAYVCTPTFIGIRMILDMCTLTRTFIIFPYDFLKFYFSGSYNFILFKNLLLYIWPLIYLFVLVRDWFFTVYIHVKETLFFNFS